MDTEKEMDKALWFLAQTDAEMAERRVAMMRAEYLCETTENVVYKTHRGDGTSVEDCKRAARSSPEFQTKFEEYLKTVREYELLKAKRKRAELTFEAARSVNANRRQAGGNP